MQRESAKLAIVAPSAYPLGGVQVWLDYLVPGLEKAGWEVDVVLVDGKKNDAQGYLQIHPFARSHLATYATGTPEGRVRTLTRTLRAVQPDLVLAVNIVDTFEAVERLRAGGMPQLKVAMALHGLDASFYQDLKLLAPIVDGAIATNRLAAMAAIRYSGIARDRSFYAACGVPIPTIPIGIQPEDRLNLLFAGRFELVEKRVMDLPRILDALASMNLDFKLRIAGSGPAEEELRRELARFADKVDFSGVLTAAQMRDSFFRMGDLLLVMSPMETGPLVAWEAMASGAAVVSSRFIGIGLEAGLVNGENCATFPIGDIQGAATAIAQLRDPATRLRIIRRAKETVTAKYSQAHSTASWDAALRAILRLPRLPSRTVQFPMRKPGRLERLIGKQIAETGRERLGFQYQHAEAGGEWPHTFGLPTDVNFTGLLNRLDKP
ncbi:glycosyltransferase family 4 protein [Caenimonas koreensis]|uniref:glycosyltransferase family 4 protein n=1 Tax=Caenimonas koreensis TaxID=367474 RepID=UPI003784BF83